MAPSTPISVWKLPKINMIAFNKLSFGALLMISDAFQSKGLSKVIIGEILFFSARLQIYVRVERMHVGSPGYISIIGKNVTENLPDCLDPL